MENDLLDEVLIADAEGIRTARLLMLRRCVATTIDLALVLVWVQWIMGVLRQLTYYELFDGFLLVLGLIVFSMSYFLYTVSLEGLFARTLGKWLCQLKVQQGHKVFPLEALFDAEIVNAKTSKEVLPKRIGEQALLNRAQLKTLFVFAAPVYLPLFFYRRLTDASIVTYLHWFDKKVNRNVTIPIETVSMY